MSTGDGWGDTGGGGGWGDTSSSGGGGGWGDSGNSERQEGRPFSRGGRGGRGGRRGGRGGGCRDGGRDGGGGWGSNNDDNRQNNRSSSGGGGWGDNNDDDNQNRRSSSGGGGWGDTGSSGGGGGGWGDSGNSERPEGRSFGRGGRGGRRGGGGRGGGGGWGSSNDDDRQNNRSSSGGGGWGDNNDDQRPNKCRNNGGGGGGWGDSNDDNQNRRSSGGGGGGGWGDDDNDDNRQNNRSSNAGGGGWGDDKDNDGQNKRPRSDTQNGQNKRPRREDQDGEEGERPAPYKPEELDLDEEARLQGDGAGENFQRYEEQKVLCFPNQSITPVERFEDIVTSKLLLENVGKQKYTSMTPIQKWAMPAIKEGHDLIGCAQTGSGKTAAFLLPVLQTLLNMDLETHDPNSDCVNPYCLIISPTRELANQIHVHANMLSKDSVVKCVVIYGQTATFHLKSKLSQGCHILVATCGRLKDFVERGWIGFKNIKYVILDEGDRLVDDGFSADIENFLSHPTMPSKQDRQTLFFSATFRSETQVTAKTHLKEGFIFLTVGRIGAANQDIKQEFLQVSREAKKRVLKEILMEVPDSDKCIVFTQTKIAADMLAGFFTALNLSSTSIHGDRLQSQREQAIKAFKRGEKKFLISSPVGNRGLDLPKVSLVINYDLPNNIDEYVHRIGRTGRAGHTGRAISFYDETRDRELVPELVEILTEAKQEIPEWMTNTSAGGGGDAAGNGDWADSAQATTTNNDDEDWGASSNVAASTPKESTAAEDDDWGASASDPKEPAAVETVATNDNAW